MTFKVHKINKTHFWDNLKQTCPRASSFKLVSRVCCHLKAGSGFLKPSNVIKGSTTCYDKENITLSKIIFRLLTNDLTANFLSSRWLLEFVAT